MIYAVITFLLIYRKLKAQRIRATDALHPPPSGVRAVARCRKTTSKPRVRSTQHEVRAARRAVLVQLRAESYEP